MENLSENKTTTQASPGLAHEEQPKKSNVSKVVLFSSLAVLVGLIGFGVYRNFQFAQQAEKIAAQQPNIPISYPTPTPPLVRCNNAQFTINQPTGYTFSKECLYVPNQIYSDDVRFTFFNLPPYLRNIAYVRTGNIKEKQDKSLQWSVALGRTSDVYVLYRKIPNQTPPKWIKDNYVKVTPDNFVELITYALRKNELGLIGVYDIYKLQTPNIKPTGRILPRPSGLTGTITFGPASDQSVTAYSMYIVAIKSY